MPFLFVVVAVGVAGFIAWQRDDTARTMIASELLSRHASNIDIARDWFDFDRDTATYDVSYTDAAGHGHTNRAKVATRFFADNSVYWLNPFSDA